jgi:hypothetical protein
MKEIFKNDIVTIKHDQENSFLEVHWSDQCGNLLDDDYNKELNKIHTAAKINSSDYVLVNLNACEYIEPDQHHRWTENTIFSEYSDIGAKKMAFVVPDNLFAQVSFEANHMSLSDADMQIQYFRDEDKARLWLQAE